MHSQVASRKSQGLMVMIFAFCVLQFAFGPLVRAEPCPASGCGTGYCARDPRLPDGSACYARCTFGAPETGCSGGYRCINFSGQGICVFNDSPLIEGDAVNPRCDGGRSCPTDRTYVCASGECRIAAGQPCDRTSQCQEDAECVATSGGGKTCNPTERSVVVTPEGEVKFEPITPTLGVEIPGASLSPAAQEGGDVVIPFLPQYINAIYRYAVTIVLIAAIIMVVYGGFRYLVGASIGDIQAGKKIIIDAIVGMLIVLGAYMILNTINPALVTFSPLRLEIVNEQQLLLTIETPTGDWEAAESETGPAPSGGVAAEGEVNPLQPSGISFTPPPPNPYSTCPVVLNNAITTSPRYLPRDSRVEEFLTKAPTVITARDTRARVIAASQAAAACAMHMGSCGNTTKTINGFAGVSGAGRTRQSIGSENVRFLTQINQDCVRNHPGDRNCKLNARRQAYQRFSSQISGWPNEWARALQPGDHIWIYTAHSGGAGQHAAIFLGWAGPGRARVFNGAFKNNVRESTFCITTDCRNLYPITQVWSPD
ncbi:hypothetical protein EDM68_04825 [Candidatus Uhrbacteria bacterium]|nr:MAG: hypothetical protein EDM68_04825 [Candidatus Uhrbacteria bacterium]